MVTEVAEYGGEEVLAVSCTQLGTAYSAAQARRVVEEWVEFFAAGPSGVRDLEFVTRTPKRLFAALRGQTQLQRLAVKWGDYEDLSSLSELENLRELRLGGASRVTSVEPLACLTTLNSLVVEGLRRAHDLSPLGRLRGLKSLELGGDWKSPRTAHVQSIDFLRHLTQLEDLLLHTIVADDLEYTSLLALPRLKSVRVMEVRGMNPPHATLRRMLSWSA
ncbi:hypothetical protein BWI15_35305 [Kribbella sp. ALI-6-A]|uniref:hypothetical protein n=1 Tax=Kribbella sp. ALI-6-A TaxID=1933817 RepID=UPI0009CCC3D1|nr:hypothetical protein [Kribbella sp. ALI-6-A]ONI68288.1 hypothetical protein BWI15_35305 [Kribbella sp. ALI-6-A]